MAISFKFKQRPNCSGVLNMPLFFPQDWSTGTGSSQPVTSKSSSSADDHATSPPTKKQVAQQINAEEASRKEKTRDVKAKTKASSSSLQSPVSVQSTDSPLSSLALPAYSASPSAGSSSSAGNEPLSNVVVVPGFYQLDSATVFSDPEANTQLTGKDQVVDSGESLEGTVATTDKEEVSAVPHYSPTHSSSSDCTFSPPASPPTADWSDNDGFAEENCAVAGPRPMLSYQSRPEDFDPVDSLQQPNQSDQEAGKCPVLDSCC